MQAAGEASEADLALDELLHDTHVVVAPAQHAHVVPDVIDADEQSFGARSLRRFDLEGGAERHVVRGTELRDLLRTHVRSYTQEVGPLLPRAETTVLAPVAGQEIFALTADSTVITCVNLFSSRHVRISTSSCAHVMFVSGISGVSSSAGQAQTVRTPGPLLLPWRATRRQAMRGAAHTLSTLTLVEHLHHGVCAGAPCPARADLGRQAERRNIAHVARRLLVFAPAGR
jgi:hypothetical protein